MVNDASNVVYDGINVDAGGVKTAGAAFELGGSNSTVRNARVGNVVDEKAMLASGSNLTVDNVSFHDAIYQTDGIHMECLYAVGVPGFTIRNSSFRDCAIMDLFFTYGNWWTPLPPSYGNVTIENNVFAHPELERNAGWHAYSLFVNFIGPNGNSDPMSGWVVRNNTFETDAYLTPESGSNGTRWVGNLGGWSCRPGITYRFNVGERCSAQDKAVSPAVSTLSTTAAFGWINPSAHDFRLRPGSPAINAGDPADAPVADRDGLARDARPDAGAHEFGATRRPGAPGSEPPAGSGQRAAGALRIRRARLSRRTICVRRTRRCPSVARLQIRVSAPARVGVRVERLRKGRKPRKVLSFKRKVRVKRVATLRARRLGRGRYRVIVSARTSAGLRAKSKRLRLRVR
jgi:hypothetical protein